MAIYHLQGQVISRGNGKTGDDGQKSGSGRSAIRAAAYRSGCDLKDERTGEIYRYNRKERIYKTKILAPLGAPDWTSDREKLWNKVEQRETRVNSQLARELNIALPIELSHEAKCELVEKWVNDKYVSLGLVADIAYHDFESHNPHAHIMVTTRVITPDGFGRKTRECDSKDFFLDIRSSWADYANQALKAAGSDKRIDHRTLDKQGIDRDERLPQIHLGHKTIALEKRGIRTEKYEHYKEIEAANQVLKFNRQERERQEREKQEQERLERQKEQRQAREQQEREKQERERKKQAETRQTERPVPAQRTATTTTQPPTKSDLKTETLTDKDLLFNISLLNYAKEHHQELTKERQDLELELTKCEVKLWNLLGSIEQQETFLTSNKPRLWNNPSSWLNSNAINAEDYEVQEAVLNMYIDDLFKATKVQEKNLRKIEQMDKYNLSVEKAKQLLTSPSPHLQARINKLDDIITTHRNVIQLLDNKTSLKGKIYNLKRVDNTINIYRKDKLIFSGIDEKIKGNYTLADIIQSDLTNNDKDIFQSAIDEVNNFKQHKKAAKSQVKSQQIEY